MTPAPTSEPPSTAMIARSRPVNGNVPPEAFVPGFGWRAYDPTHGLDVSDGHVALSAAPDQAGTMPVEGGFYGEGVSSNLSYTVEIATDPA